MIIMSKRIKKKLLRRLNIKHWKDAPNIDNITRHNRYHKKNNDFMCVLHGNHPYIHEKDVDLSNITMFFTGGKEEW